MYTILPTVIIVMLVTGLQPKKFETFLAVRAFARLIECSLLLWRSSKVEKDDRGVAKAVSMFARVHHSLLCALVIFPHLCCSAHEDVEKLKLLACKFTVFKPRYLHLNAYRKYLHHKQAQARKLLSASVHEADSSGNRFDEEWATHSKQAWFGTTSTENNSLSGPRIATLYTVLRLGFVDSSIVYTHKCIATGRCLHMVVLHYQFDRAPMHTHKHANLTVVVP